MKKKKTKRRNCQNIDSQLDGVKRRMQEKHEECAKGRNCGEFARASEGSKGETDGRVEH